MRRSLPPLLLCTLAAVAGVVGAAGADPVAISVPNASFESPSAPFVSINVDNWQKTDKPPEYDESGGFLWTQLTGLFANTVPTSSDHLDNCDGAQAIWLFAVPKVGLFQDYDSVDWNDTAPTHAFNATFEIGKSYDLTVGVNGSGGGMLEGTSMALSLYYRDTGGNQVPVATTNVVYTADVFPNHTHFVDFVVHVPVVKPGDPWAGQHIGMLFLSTVSADLQGGYWDLDNVRLTSTVGPPFPVSTTPSGANLHATWPSALGYTYQVQLSNNFASWGNYGQPQTGTGNPLSTDVPLASSPKAFVRVQVTPTP